MMCHSFDMKIRFLKECKAKQKTTTYCGDGCCSWDKWIEQTFFPNQEEEAIEEESGFPLDGTVSLSGLTFNEDYIIIEFP